MEPLGIISWSKAFNLYWEDKATVLWNYPDRKIHSARDEWDWPSILSLKYMVKRRPDREINPSTRSILVRDLYTCQFCGVKLTNSSGTKDHVIPESRKGPSTWDNLVAACRVCQEKKGDKLPEECGMYPKTTPRAPTLAERFQNNIRVASSYERKNWRLGLKKLGLDYLLED
jgi:5-methylcytosine-specific restriction endonuclease McrA